MDLLNNLYTITREDTGEGLFTIRLNADCFIYAAHFPDKPITPGVCMIQMVRELAERMLDARLTVNVIKSAKFLKVLQPDDRELTVSIKVKKREEDEISFQGIIADKEDNIYAKVSLQTSIA